MATYTQLAKQVLDWSNRDVEVLSYDVIKTCLTWGQDDIFRTLRVAPMEYTTSWPISIDSDDTDEYNSLSVPDDLIEVIQLRKQDSNSVTGYVAYNSKADLRSFYNEEIKLAGYVGTSYYVFAREADCFRFWPPLKDSEVYEMTYYRRLADLDARYALDLTDTESLYQYFDTDSDALKDAVREAEGDTVFDADPELESKIYYNDVSDYGFKPGYYLGKLTPNWLRDQNQKLLLYAGLYQVFDYLDEMETAEKWKSRMMEEIAELNNEDKMRMAKSGITTIHYSGNGLI